MMSGPLASFSAQEDLRRSFAVWGLAIFSSLTSTGSVMLDRASVWAADDPASPAVTAGPLDGPKPQGSHQAGGGQETESGTGVSPSAFSREQLLALLSANKIAEAAQRVDAALAAEPSVANYHLSFTLASYLSDRDPTAAAERLKSILAALIDRLDDPAASRAVTCYAMSAEVLAIVLDDEGESEQALAVLEDAAEKVAALPATMRTGLLGERCRVLVKLRRVDEARVLMDDCVAEAFRRAEQVPTLGNRMAVPAALGAYSRLFRDRYPDQLKAYRQKAESLAQASLDKESAGPDDYLVYQTLQIATAMELSPSDAEAARAILVDLQERETRFKEQLTDDEQKRLLPFEQTLQAALSRNATVLQQQQLIGQPAPEFDIGSVIAMQPVRWADLKGKVVLLDFWAVWCRPCIDSFPELRRLHREYSDRGLVIIGVTRPYGYTWLAESKLPLPKETASLDEELAMLAGIRQLHELPYGFLVTPPQSTYSQKFGVTVIPQVVVVDKNGIIRLIGGGGGEKNISALEAKLEELLDQAE